MGYTRVSFGRYPLAAVSCAKLDFEWDANKASQNQAKHGISFELAGSAFFDPFIAALDDEIVDGELRYTAVAMTITWQILTIVYVWRGDTIRLISARPATSYERKAYENR